MTSSNKSATLYQVKLLQALQTGDPALIHPFLDSLRNPSASDSSSVSRLDTGATALHLAICCATPPTVALLLSHRAISPNAVHPPPSGTTALHLAASLGRVDVVRMLLEQEGIDDTLRDAKGRSVRDVARGREVVKAIQDSHTYLNASFRSLFRSYILSPPNAPPPPALISLLGSPRARFIDLSYLHDTACTSILHEAARRRDLRLIELVVRAGADVFVRDEHGRMPGEGLGTAKDERVRVFLKQFANHDSTLLLGENETVSASACDADPPMMKGYLNKYANVAKGYNTRWFVLKNGILSYYRHQSDKTVASRGSISLKSAILKLPSTTHTNTHTHSSTTDRTRIEVQAHGQKWYMKASHPVEAAQWAAALRRSVEWAWREGGESLGFVQSQGSASGESVDHFSSRRARGADVSVSANTSFVGGDVLEDEDDEDADESSEGEGEGETRRPPHEDVYFLQENAALAQMELTLDLVTSLGSGGVSSSTSASTSTSTAPTPTHDILIALSTAHALLSTHIEMSRARDAWFNARAARARRRQEAWAESLAVVVREGEGLERELRGMGRGMGVAAGKVERETAIDDNDEEDMDGEADEDEFFDAIESGTLAGVLVSPALLPGGVTSTSIPPSTTTPTTTTTTLSPPSTPMHLFHSIPAAPYAAYLSLRTTIDSLKDDQRPRTSLWSVLKHSIGKDLMRISFPVYFNEPTSMLQRMAEDMEFSECLDAAVKEQDPLRRIAFVAAFAMSNYSSTIGCIAKPFNPMLSETFEYVRFDKQFRYYSEQVSHHPPISACWAEAPSWHYYGEVDAQNKFMGKSFEIRPTGVAHAELILPVDWVGQGYPRAPAWFGPDKAVEHYSWKKVTTNVSGFILGSPTIDHYGDMIVTNHRTGDQCVLTFKPRGWRGKDAFEIAGQVIDASGQPAYRIAGRWNSQLIASPVNPTTTTISLNPDLDLDSSITTTTTATPAHFLLWHNSHKPLGSPFNLTPFTTTLNDCPPSTLGPYICPTDSRLRPDQRAFEMGDWECANELKRLQEEKQRAARRARENEEGGGRAQHCP
ncbi:hypothetical protein C0995_007016, partial [Termitomyces sp. Mi166